MSDIFFGQHFIEADQTPVIATIVLDEGGAREPLLQCSLMQRVSDERKN